MPKHALFFTQGQLPSDDTADDDRLIAAVLSGDAERFAPLVARYQQRVLRFIQKYEYNSGDVQDLAQETFLQAFRSLPSFNGQSRFSTWLISIAFNLLKNHLSRSPAKHHVHLDIDEQPESASRFADGDPERLYESRQSLAALERAIAMLSLQMHDAVVLVAIEGLSYEGAARAMGKPIGSVKSRLCRARVQLAQALLVHQTH